MNLGICNNCTKRAMQKCVEWDIKATVSKCKYWKETLTSEMIECSEYEKEEDDATKKTEKEYENRHQGNHILRPG